MLTWMCVRLTLQHFLITYSLPVRQSSSWLAVHITFHWRHKLWLYIILFLALMNELNAKKSGLTGNILDVMYQSWIYLQFMMQLCAMDICAVQKQLSLSMSKAARVLNNETAGQEYVNRAINMNMMVGGQSFEGWLAGLHLSFRLRFFKHLVTLLWVKVGQKSSTREHFHAIPDPLQCTSMHHSDTYPPTKTPPSCWIYGICTDAARSLSKKMHVFVLCFSPPYRWGLNLRLCMWPMCRSGVSPFFCLIQKY